MIAESTHAADTHQVTPPEKPSKRIGASGDAIIAALLAQQRIEVEKQLKEQCPGRQMTDEIWAQFLASPDGIEFEATCAQAASVVAICEELDREAERRAAWERSAEKWMVGAGKLLNAIASIPMIAVAVAEIEKYEVRLSYIGHVVGNQPANPGALFDDEPDGEKPPPVVSEP